jgi:hypothetical protein
MAVSRALASICSTTVLALAACGGGDGTTVSGTSDPRGAFDSAIDGIAQGDAELFCSSTVLLPVDPVSGPRPAEDLSEAEIDEAIQSYDAECLEQAGEFSGGEDPGVELLEFEVSGRIATGLVHEEQYPQDPDPVEFVQSSEGEWRMVMAGGG